MRFSDKLKVLKSKMHQNIQKTHEEDVQQLYEEIMNNVPIDTGMYMESIKIRETENNNGVLKTKVSSNMMVGPAKSSGKSYNLGKLLEYGTDPHAIPNAFNWGVIYGFESDMYKRTEDPNWHPGTIEQPHFTPAKLKMERVHKQNIKKAVHSAIKEAIK